MAKLLGGQQGLSILRNCKPSITSEVAGKNEVGPMIALHYE
jgi:hypothetical protein